MRRFEMVEGTSSKFWEVATEGKNVVVRFGRIGTDGQTKSKAYASPDAATKEAEKLVKEKTGKGYAEVGRGAAKQPSAKAAPVKATPAQGAPAKAAPVKATGVFSYSKELDALYELGWPWLRTLTDEAVTPAKAAAEAVKGLSAIDPYFPTAIPRETARRYLRGYPLKAFSPEQKKFVAADEKAVDVALLEEVLEKKWGPSKSREYGDETYDFRLAEIVFLFEAFLGTEAVAKVLIDHMIRARDNVKWWGHFVDHDHQAAPRLASTVVGWLRLRMPSATWKKLLAPLKGSKEAKLPKYCALLNQLADDSVASGEINILLQRRDAKAAAKYFTDYPRAWYHDPQHFFVAGADLLMKFDTSKVKQLAKWQQLRLIDEMGTIRGPGAVRLISALVESRSAGTEAAAWLEARGEKAAAPAPKVNKKELEKQVKAIFTGIEKVLVAQKGNAKKERKVMDEAFAKYAELRAALGDVSPEAYFTHSFADVTPKWKADEATSQRWIDLAVESAGG